jgi:hypothetical protein
LEQEENGKSDVRIGFDRGGRSEAKAIVALTHKKNRRQGCRRYKRKSWEHIKTVWRFYRQFMWQ